MRRSVCYTFCFLLAFHALWGQDEDLRLLNYYQYYGDQENVLYKQMVKEAEKHFEVREQKIASLTTPQDWQTYQGSIKQKLMQLIGPLPEKTPLNPQVTGTIERADFTVEKIIYESQPGFYITAALFLPKKLQEKAPAIIYCSGHSPLGFRSDVYQNKIINLVKKGFVVLAFDPLGQGERMQYPDEEGIKSLIGGPTDEHGYVGARCFLTGSSLAKYMIWDGIRTVDYLLTRPEVDPQRIGLTGRSGGGTQTTYIAAFDDRIQAAAPEAYLTRLETLMKTEGPQDAEQNIPYFIDQELDLADFLIVRAPKPTLIVSTTRDMFSIAGARETYHEVKRAYQALGNPAAISMSEDDAPHASTLKNREAMYAFFRKYLQNPGDSHEEEVTLFRPEELWATPNGQVALDLGSRNVFGLNRDEAIQKKERIRKERVNFESQKVITKAKALTGYQSPSTSQKVHFAGQYSRDGYKVQKYLMIEEEQVTPFLLFVPDQARKKETILYFHPDGKTVQAAPGEQIEAWVKQGIMVLSADVRGTGELGPGYLKGDAYIDSVSYNQWFGGMLLHQSIVARQAEDMVRMARYLTSAFKEREISITAIAHSTLTPALLHAAAFEPTIQRTVLVEPLYSYESLVTHEQYDARWVHGSVNNAMNNYDLADLAASLAPRHLLVVNPIDHQFNSANPSEFEQEWAFVREQYQNSGNVKILVTDDGQQEEETIINWLR
uniref:Acetylxylan esterase n=1 Tax=Roseihalotalea indica TaxID=2867963 RepID=A0AA49JCI0_9BACT|nr:acetylxylan esterase [Tunicatimonas sp. TK19036]